MEATVKWIYRTHNILSSSFFSLLVYINLLSASSSSFDSQERERDHKKKICLLRFSPPPLSSFSLSSTWVPATCPMELLSKQHTSFTWLNPRCHQGTTSTPSGTIPHSDPSQSPLSCSTLTTTQSTDSPLA